MVSVERVVQRGLREEWAISCGEGVVEVDAYCTCIECRIAWWEEVGLGEGCWRGE